MTESKILYEVRAWLASQPDVSIHRNNTGKVQVTLQQIVEFGIPTPWAGKCLAFINSRFRAMSFGLAIGSSDLIGSLTVQCPPENAQCAWSKLVARALAIEVKTAAGRVTEDQERFLAEKRRIGWITGVVRSVAEVEALIGSARRWEL